MAREMVKKCPECGGINLIVQPSFNLVTEGTDITKERLLSPFLKQDLGDFEVFIVSDKIYKFGKVKDITYTS
jgi:metallophosphoesterase superfamily enzyme